MTVVEEVHTSGIFSMTVPQKITTKPFMNKTQALGITVQSINQKRGSLMFDFIIWSRSAFTSSDVDAMVAISKLFLSLPHVLPPPSCC